MDEQAKQCETRVQGQIGMAIDREFQDQAMRAGLKDRIVSRAVHSQNEANRLMRLNRLAELMEKYPDFCEIIDLLQSLNLL